MKNQRDKLRQYQKRITVLTDREKAIAKECLLKGDTNRAKLALRRKKYQEGLIQKTDAQLAQLEQLTSDVEFALVQKDVLFGLQQGTAVLKEIHKEMGGIENVEKLLGENAEARAYQEVRMIWLLLSNKKLADATYYRKSASCWRTKCRTKTKTRSKTSSRPSNKQSRVTHCPTHPSHSPSLRQNKKHKSQEIGRKEGLGSVLLNKSRRQNLCWHSSHQLYVCIERGVGVILSTAIFIDGWYTAL